MAWGVVARGKGRVLYGGGARHKPGRQVGPFATRGRPKVADARTPSPTNQHDRGEREALPRRATEMMRLGSNMVASPHAKKLEDLRRRTRTPLSAVCFPSSPGTCTDPECPKNTLLNVLPMIIV